MNWIFFAITCGVLNAVGSQALKRETVVPEEQAGFRLVFYSLCVLIPTIVCLIIRFDVGSWQFAASALGTGVFTSLNIIFLLIAIKLGPLSILWVIAWMAGPLGGILWLIYPGTDDFTILHIFGLMTFVLTLISLGRAVNKQDEEKKKVGVRFMFYAVLCSVVAAGATYLIKFSSSFGTYTSGSAYTFVVFWSITNLLGVTMNSLVRTGVRFRFEKNSIRWAVLGGSAISIEMILLQYGSGFGPALEYFSLVAATALIMAAILARIFQKELITFYTMLGILFGILSIVIFSL